MLRNECNPCQNLNDDEFLKLGRGGGCTALGMHQMPPDGALKWLIVFRLGDIPTCVVFLFLPSILL